MLTIAVWQLKACEINTFLNQTVFKKLNMNIPGFASNIFKTNIP